MAPSLFPIWQPNATALPNWQAPCTGFSIQCQKNPKGLIELPPQGAIRRPRPLGRSAVDAFSPRCPAQILVRPRERQIRGRVAAELRLAGPHGVDRAAVDARPRA